MSGAVVSTLVASAAAEHFLCLLIGQMHFVMLPLMIHGIALNHASVALADMRRQGSRREAGAHAGRVPAEPAGAAHIDRRQTPGDSGALFCLAG